MTQVTIKNFCALLPTLARVIREASYIAIDTEITGLHITKQHQPNHFQTLQKRWTDIKENAEGLQVNNYKHKPKQEKRSIVYNTARSGLRSK